MSNEQTLLNRNMYGANAKQKFITHILLAGAAKLYAAIPVHRKITVTSVSFTVGNVAGTFSTALGTWGLYKGTLAAIAAAKAGSNLTGLTAVASKTAVAGDLVAATNSELTLSTTAADLDVDGVVTAPVGLCAYCDVQASNTFPAGIWTVEYVCRDVDP